MATSPFLADKLSAFDPTLPLERAKTIPNSWYFDPEIHSAECDTIFGNTWQIAGRAELVYSPRQYLTAQIAKTPVVVLRDEQASLRAFVNVCKHRAARVITEPAGVASRLRCPYHGWTYDLHGQLRGTPEFDGVIGFRREDHGLCPVAADVWGPLVWIHQTPPSQSLCEYLAPLPERLSGSRLEQFQFFQRREYDIACNWKVYVDNFLDGGYHVNSIHPGLSSVLDYSQYRTELANNTSVQTSPLRSSDEMTDSAVERTRTSGAAQYWWVFPNFMLNIYGDIMDTNVVLPIGPDRCRVVFDFYFRETPFADSPDLIDESIAVSEQIQHEDIHICEDVQRGLTCGAFDTGRFSVRREAAVYHFHKLLARHLVLASE